MEIISTEEYINIINNNSHHFSNLLEIVIKSGEPLEGDCIYEHLTTNRKVELIPKQENIFSIGKQFGNKIIEIGFNAGHSALLFLLSNPEAYLWCFDICYHSYTRPCFQYLYDNFEGRLSLFSGNSINTFPEFASRHEKEKFDIIHIDGSCDINIANIDFFTSLNLIRNEGFIIWNDRGVEDLGKLWNGYINSGHVLPLNFLETDHKIGYVLKPLFNIAVCSLSIGEKYKNMVKYGIRTKEQYCKKHNYDYYDEEKYYDRDRPIAWSKINIINSCLNDDKNNYDYVVWIDADTLVMNQEIKIEELIEKYTDDKDVTVAQDYKMINTGVIIIKNTLWSRRFFDFLYDQTQFIDHPNWEQGAFINLYENNISESQKHINVLPLELQNKLNSYWFTYNYDDCFILHFPGCWRDNTEYGLSLAFEQHCPIKMDDEDDEKYQNRINWLKNGIQDTIKEKIKAHNQT